MCPRHAVHIDGGSAQQKVGIFKLMSIFLADGVQNLFCLIYNFRSDSVTVNLSNTVFHIFLPLFFRLKNRSIFSVSIAFLNYTLLSP